MYRHFFKFFFISFFLVGCSVIFPSVPQSKIMQLSKLLQSLDRSIPSKEVEYLSRDIFDETSKLIKEFKLTSPPWFHNILVNVGVRDQGLCYHWSDSLYVHLLEKKYPHFDFHLVGANIGEYLFEHNVLVVTAKGSGVLNGVLIDPWRDSGELYFSRVFEDKKYTWKHRIDRCLCQNGK
jgi:hypothetical protein